MQNVTLFNDFVLQLLDHLNDRFPVPCAINHEDFIPKIELSPYPPNPVNTYCGPDMSWSFLESDEEQKVCWDTHPWEQVIAEVEALLSRPLTDDEQVNLLRSGKRPASTDEQELLAEWEEEKIRIGNLRPSQVEKYEDTEKKREVFRATLQFLTNEKLIRFIDLPPVSSEGGILNPPDILIERSINRLRFVLTSTGFTHLNRVFTEGNLRGKLTLYQVIKKTLKEKSVDGVSAVGIQTLVGWILSN